MRAGQPCLAHSVGGLSDTIVNNENGFTFNGKTPNEQAENMLSCFQNALEIKLNDASQWKKIASNALKARFLWEDVANDYLSYLYSD